MPKNSPIPATAPAELRVKVREVLGMVPDRGFSEGMILDAVRRLVPWPVDLLAMRTALEWNLSSGYIDYRFERDLDLDVWQLTDRGRTKQNISAPKKTAPKKRSRR